MIVARTVGGLDMPGAIKKMEEDLHKVIAEFDAAVMKAETLRRTTEPGEHLFLRGALTSTASCRGSSFV